jgi:hypothetical protein
MTELLEQQLDGFDPAQRRQALLGLQRQVEEGKITLENGHWNRQAEESLIKQFSKS